MPWRVIAVLSGYGALLFFLLSKQQEASAYGFPVPVPAPDVIGMVAALAPTLFFVAALLEQTFIAAERPATRSFGLPEVFFASAALVLTTLITAVGGNIVVEKLLAHGAAFAWLGLEADFLLITGFAQLLRLCCRRWLLVIPAGVAYYALALFIGTKLDVLPFVGFDTTPPVTITTFATMPLGSAAAWAWRAYWLITLAILALTKHLLNQRRATEVGKSSAHSGRLGIILAIACLCVGWACMVSWLAGERTKLTDKYPTPIAPIGPFSSIVARPQLTAFSVVLDARDPNRVRIKGHLHLVNRTTTAISALLLEHAQMLEITGLQSDRALQWWSSTDRRLVSIKLAHELRPGASLNVRFDARENKSSWFDTNVSSRLSADGIFLQAPAILPLPRVSACVVEHNPSAICAAGENYLLGDRAVGRIFVAPPYGLVVAGGKKIGNTQVYELSFDGRELSNVLVAAARYEVRVVHSTSCGPITLFTTSSPYLGPLAQEMCRARKYYADLFGTVPSTDLRIVEVPNSITEAMAYPNVLAISERLVSPASKDGLNPILRFIVWHESAHAWWGYGVIPQEGGGLGFALEAVPQFLAMKNANPDRRYAEVEAALAASQTRAVAQFGQPVEPISSSGLDWQAYIRGPLALWRLGDPQVTERSLSIAFGRLLRREGPYSGSDLAAYVLDATPTNHQSRTAAILGLADPVRSRCPKPVGAEKKNCERKMR